MTTFLLITAIILLTLASAFCSLSEIAFFSIPASRIKAYRYNLNPRKRQIARLLKQSRSLLVTIFFLNTVVNILVQNLSSDLFDQPNSSWLLKVGAPLGLILIFGELFPKYLGLLYSEQVSNFAAPFYEWFQNITSPIRHAITRFANFFSRVIFFGMKIEKPLSQDELEHLFQTSEGLGIVQPEEVKLLQGYLSLEGKFAKDVMIPRNRMSFYDVEEPLSKLIFLFSEEDLEEVPMCQDSLDNFIGMVSSCDFLLRKNEMKSGQDILKIIHKPLFVPETTTLKSLLQQFEDREKRIALIVDEYGAISGLLSRNDLLNEVAEPSQSVKDEQLYVKAGKDAIIANGVLPLRDVSELFEQNLMSAYHSVTIGGYLIEKLGIIPQSGATYQEGNLHFRILSADQTRIRKVYIQYHKGETV